MENYAALYAVNATSGGVVWSDELQTQDGLYDPVVIGTTVYAGSVFDDVATGESGGGVWAWDKKTGQRLWTATTAGHVGSAAAVDSTGAMYIGDRSGNLIKFK